MAGEYLIFDVTGGGPGGEDTGSPLNIGPGTNYRLREWSAPAPPQTVQYAGSVDTEGGIPASRKHENRVITLKIMCDTAAALRSLQGKIGKIAREGGTLEWILPNAEVVIFDLLTADTFEPEFRVTFYRDVGRYCDVMITLIAKPYGRGPAVTLTDHTETTLPALVFTETGIKGDMPAVGKLVIDNDQSTGQVWLTWGLHSRDFLSTSLTPLLIQAENTAGGLITHGSGVASTAVASASGGNAARSTSLGSSIAEFLTFKTYHQGEYRVYARVFAPTANTGIVSLQLWWSPTVLTTNMVANDMVDIASGASPLENAWYLVDLGMIRPRKDQLDTGNVASPNTIYAQSTVAGDDLDIDWIMLVPADEGSGRTTSVMQVTPNGVFTVHGGGAAVSQLGASGPWGTDYKYAGDYLRIPPAGAEARTVQFVVKMSRNITTSGTTGPVIDDAGIDDLSARLTYTPRYLVVPEP